MFVLRIAADSIYNTLAETLAEGCGKTITSGDLGIAAVSRIVRNFVYGALKVIVPSCAAIALFSFIINGVQTRFRFTFSLVKPKLSRINPLAGFRKMFSGKSLAEFFKSFVKVTVIVLVLYTEFKTVIKQVLSLPYAGMEDILGWVAGSVYDMVMKLAVIMAVFGAADYLYQWWSYEKSIRMTKQEVKDEYKKLEGDPQIKGRIREIQRKMATMRMMHNVPKADVVIKNPTHYAVALKYDMQKDSAPVVVAKGRDYLALRIIKVAEEHGVYITENRPLARGLYEAVEVNQKIPEQFYKAVAEIIAFLYKLRKEKGRQS